MKRLAGFVVGVAMSAAVATGGAAARPSTATPATPGPPRAAATYVVVQPKAALQYGGEQIGELPEATRVLVLRKAGQWTQVRADFGDAWVVGWVSSSAIEPDSLRSVGIEVGRATREYSFERRSLPGLQFLVVRVRFTAQAGGPSRVYLGFAEAETADLYVVHSRDKKVAPYGFMVQEPMSEKRTFETTRKRQVLELKGGKPLVETYVFAVPPRARSFELVVKDVKLPVRLRR